MRLRVLVLAASLAAAGCGGNQQEPKHAESEPGANAGLYNEGGATKDQKERVDQAVETVKETQIRITTAIGLALRVMAAVWMVARDGCPTADELVKASGANATVKATDAWENPYKITCDAKGPIVRSAGPDGVMGTPDDIVLAGEK